MVHEKVGKEFRASMRMIEDATRRLLAIVDVGEGKTPWRESDEPGGEWLRLETTRLVVNIWRSLCEDALGEKASEEEWSEDDRVITTEKPATASDVDPAAQDDTT